MIENEDELHLHNEYNPSADTHGHDEDRLPWLEAVEPDAEHDGHRRSGVTGVLILGLVALGILIGGIWWMNSQTPPVKSGDGNLIAAADGDYKTKPADAGGMKVEGRGDSATAAAAGTDTNGKIDANAKPEAPIAPAAAKPVTALDPSKPNSTAKIADVRDVTPKPAPAPIAAAAANAVPAGSGVIQLGAYGTKSSAEQGWSELKAKYDFLAAMPQTIVPASVGGSTVYRLRASAGNAAAQTCTKLKAAGANCIIAH